MGNAATTAPPGGARPLEGDIQPALVASGSARTDLRATDAVEAEVILPGQESRTPLLKTRSLAGAVPLAMLSLGLITGWSVMWTITSGPDGLVGETQRSLPRIIEIGPAADPTEFEDTECALARDARLAAEAKAAAAAAELANEAMACEAAEKGAADATRERDAERQARAEAEAAAAAAKDALARATPIAEAPPAPAAPAEFAGPATEPRPAPVERPEPQPQPVERPAPQPQPAAPPPPRPKPAREPDTRDGDARTALAEGRSQLSRKNIAAARAAFERAERLGLPEGALALGLTYDPVALAKSGISAAGDPGKARAWYRRAHELAQLQAR